MNDIKVASAQFEHKSGDKMYNLATIRSLSYKAAQSGAKLVAFHECSITGYTFARRLSKEQLLALAEYVPGGPSLAALTQMAIDYDIAICAGLFERDDAGNVYKAYVCVDASGLVAKYRKLHPFINPFLTAGDAYCVFEWSGWKWGILICYDNNIIENVRATKLLGADIILMPHATMCTPSPRPGAGFVDPALWRNREKDPTSLRAEFNGLKGRQWLMKWLPARAYDNAVYCIFSNPIGMDDDQLKNGCSMILDPYGDILAECTEVGDQVVVSTLTADKLLHAGGARYIKARRPELYRDFIGAEHEGQQVVSWV